MATYSAPQTWVGGLVDVPDMNREIRDNFLATHGLLGYIGAHVYNSAAISIPTGVNTALTFNSERFDTDPEGEVHSTSVNPGRLTCKTPGAYDILGSVEIAAATGGHRNAQLILNGATVLDIKKELNPTAGQTVVLSPHTRYVLAANDYVELHVFQDSGAPRDALASAAYSPVLAMVKV